MAELAVTKAGYVALVGRPNVGKSTLLNQILGFKLAITAHKPQTTRHRILGIRHAPGYQIVFLDTPGLHWGKQKALNRFMNRTAQSTLHEVDAVVWLLEALKLTPEDESIGALLRDLKAPVLVAINKVDRVDDKARLLPYLKALAPHIGDRAVFLLSAQKSDGVDALEAAIVEQLPASQALYDENTVTDRSESFVAAEYIREQVVRGLHQELPYATSVTIEQFERDGKILNIAATIFVERESQKGIVIGKAGATLKRIGENARRSMEGFFGQKVYLQLWVKVRDDWSANQAALNEMGYTD